MTFDAAGLGLAPLVTGTDFLDSKFCQRDNRQNNQCIEPVAHGSFDPGLESVGRADPPDFSKNLINVLQTGSSDLTLADTNEEAANSPALSTRQSIAVSALALANQSQQSVLKLLQ